MEKILEKKVKVLELLLKNADKRCLLLSEALKVYEDENKMLKERVGISITSEDKKEVVDDATTFSSRFMPYAKFCVPSDLRNIAEKILGFNIFNSTYIATRFNGDVGNQTSHKPLYDSWNLKEVSIYEAIPELVPEGMIYDKKNDVLVYKKLPEFVEVKSGCFGFPVDMELSAEEVEYIKNTIRFLAQKS